MNEQRQAALFIAITTVLWGIPGLFIHYFALYLDAHTQNFLRYASALLLLVVFCCRTDQPCWPTSRDAFRRSVLAAALLVAYQSLFTASLYYAKPAFISLLIQLELIAAITLSCLFFADERRVVRSFWFVAGATVTAAGGAGMVLFSREFAGSDAPAAGRHVLVTALILVGGAAVFWGAYSVAIKWCLEVMPPVSALTGVEAMATAAFFMLTVTAGNWKDTVDLSAAIGLAIFLSGVACIGVAHILYTHALQRLGVVVCNTVILASPVVAAIASRLVFGERLTQPQMVSAALILLGAAAVVRTGREKQATAPRQ